MSDMYLLLLTNLLCQEFEIVPFHWNCIDSMYARGNFFHTTFLIDNGQYETTKTVNQNSQSIFQQLHIWLLFG